MPDNGRTRNRMRRSPSKMRFTPHTHERCVPKQRKQPKARTEVKTTMATNSDVVRDEANARANAASAQYALAYGLKTKTAAELRVLARKHGIKGGRIMKRDDMIAALTPLVTSEDFASTP